MGLDDPEDVIPGIIILITFVGIIGGVAKYYPDILNIPVIGQLAPLIHSLYIYIGKFLTQWINFPAEIIAYFLETTVILLCILIIVKIGY